MNDHAPVRLVLRHPTRAGKDLVIEVIDGTTVVVEERHAHTGRTRRRVVLDVARPVEVAVAAVLALLGQLGLDELRRILGGLGRDAMLRDLGPHERTVIEVAVAAAAAMDELSAWEVEDA